MENNLKFNSAICTSREQSERLLALGLKKETADCALLPSTDEITSVLIKLSIKDIKDTIPAWSLGRLHEMLPSPIPISEKLPTFHHYAYLDLSKASAHYYWEDYNGAEKALASFYGNDFFAVIVDATEWLIKEGNFPKEYLEE